MLPLSDRTGHLLGEKSTWGGQGEKKKTSGKLNIRAILLDREGRHLWQAEDRKTKGTWHAKCSRQRTQLCRDSEVGRPKMLTIIQPA